MNSSEQPQGEPTVRLNRTIVAMLVLLVVVFVGVIAGPTLIQAWEENQLLEHGTDASATIVALADTRDTVNERPVVRLTVEVEIEGRRPYRTEIVTPLSPVDLQNYRVGTRVRVRYDPENPRKAALVGPLPTGADAPQ